jgi:hypothetical protein
MQVVLDPPVAPQPDAIVLGTGPLVTDELTNLTDHFALDTLLAVTQAVGWSYLLERENCGFVIFPERTRQGAAWFKPPSLRFGLFA